MTSPDGAPDGAHLDQALRAALAPHAGRTAADRVGRGAPLREGADGMVAGVCAALARAAGVPVRVVRVAMALLALLGPGIPLYLLGLLLVPRTTDRRAAPGGVEMPLGALLGGAARGVDVVAAVLVLPAVVLGAWWLLVLGLYFPGTLAVLGAVVLVLSLLMVLAARRAAEARRTLVLATLARRAGVADDAALEELLLEQRRRAPWAWERLGEGDARAVLYSSAATAREDATTAGAAPRSGTPRRGRRDRPRAPRASVRTVLAVLAGMLAATAAGLLVTSLRPALVPELGASPLLPVVGRIATGATLATVVAAVALVVLGARGRRSIVLVIAGVLALTGTGLGATWLRLTQDTGQAPLVITGADLDPLLPPACPDVDSTWSRTVVVDLSAVTAADVESWRAQQQEAGQDPTAVVIACSPVAARTTVRMPEDLSLVRALVQDPWSSTEAGTAQDEPGVIVYWSTQLGTVRIEDAHGKEIAG
ncbi:PspC domain-containing protein [Brachybacterium squillarum]|uniref:PspC domain-containing protein n=1 Tax=Brachybacterium squillarum TaxID=661979 RepID=UPI002223123C|nr:PspC domain-containing protein [Brachybacterium squillarum]MCW1804915.1 PspC domain-containing protein [Brachybacterium squillarum]